MRKVITSKKEKDRVFSENASDKKYYSVGIGAFITRRNYNKGNYVVRTIYALTMGDEYDMECDDLAKLIDHFIEAGYEVNEFDTPEELFQFLIDGGKKKK